MRKRSGGRRGIPGFCAKGNSKFTVSPNFLTLLVVYSSVALAGDSLTPVACTIAGGDCTATGSHSRFPPGRPSMCRLPYASLNPYLVQNTKHKNKNHVH